MPTILKVIYVQIKDAGTPVAPQQEAEDLLCPHMGLSPTPCLSLGTAAASFLLCQWVHLLRFTLNDSLNP